MRNLLKAMLTTGGATLMAQVLGLISNKILALFLGTSGIGFYSLIRQVHDTGTGLGGIGAGGLPQGLAARDGTARLRLFHAALILSGFGAVIAIAILIVAPELIAGMLFDSTANEAVAAVVVCAATVGLGIAYFTISSALGAARAIAALALIGIAGAAMTALLAWPVALLAGERPYFLALLIGAPLLLQLTAACIVLRRTRFIAASGKVTRPGAAEFGYFAGFFSYNMAMSMIGTAAILFVRAGVVHKDGLEAAGLFAAGWGIGMQSMAIILSSFALYVVPTLAGNSDQERRKTLQDTATLILSLTLPALVGLLVFKALVMELLFSRDFLPAVPLLQWVLLGSYFKALGWVLAVPLLAAADLRRMFLLEAGWYALFVGGVAIALSRPDWLAGIGVAFLVSYAIYVVAAGWLTWRRFGFVPSTRFVAVFALGCLTLTVAAVLTWDEIAIRWPLALSLPLVACGVALLGLTPQQRQRAVSLGKALFGR
ncbi:MAG: Polysaccharide biosynthesis protein [Alphaproteobacteria bacterium]|jgi:PST family polysaccharide transporter|nr:Polysaccharide biosynthesis protein [Alphaproteobacteria bacterium]